MRLPFAMFAIAAALNAGCEIDGIAVNAIGGAPIPRVNVALLGPRGTTSTRADEAGRWVFNDVTCGLVSVNGVRPGFLQTTVGRSQTLLNSGSPVRGYKLEMVPQAVLTGKAIDEHGDPVMNANVTALVTRVVNGRRVFQPAGGTMTNDLGEFRLASLPPGRYVFCANANTGGPDSSGSIPAPSCYPAPPEAGAQSALTVQAGAETRVNFTIANVQAVHIRGIITGILPGMRAGVVLLPRNPNGGVFTGHPSNVTPDGRFTISGVRAGSYILSADEFNGNERFFARVPVEVSGTDVEGISVELRPAFNVPVTVTGNHGGPFPVQLRPVDSELATPPRTVKWADDGSSFTIMGVIPGSYTLDATPRAPLCVKSALVGTRDLTKDEVALTPGGQLEIVLRNDGGTVEGDVTGSDGKPAAGSVMLLQSGRARSVLTSESGHYKLSNVPPGDYTLYAWTDAQQVEYANPDWLRKFTAVAVTVAPNQTATATLIQQVPQP